MHFKLVKLRVLKSHIFDLRGERHFVTFFAHVE